MIRRRTAFGLAATLALPGVARGQAFPDRNPRYIVPFPPCLLYTSPSPRD